LAEQVKTIVEKSTAQAALPICLILCLTILSSFGVWRVLKDEQTKPDKHSGDPNEKATIGVGAQGYIPAGAPLVYTTRFENVPTATALAQQVVVTDALDANLDWSAFELLQVGFNTTTINAPAAINPQTGVVRWDMRLPHRWLQAMIYLSAEPGPPQERPPVPT
jgi:uncharacterized repeat protein (TIGR01451 family)